MASEGYKFVINEQQILHFCSCISTNGFTGKINRDFLFFFVLLRQKTKDPRRQHNRRDYSCTIHLFILHCNGGIALIHSLFCYFLFRTSLFQKCKFFQQICAKTEKICFTFTPSSPPRGGGDPRRTYQPYVFDQVRGQGVWKALVARLISSFGVVGSQEPGPSTARKMRYLLMRNVQNPEILYRCWTKHKTNHLNFIFWTTIKSPVRILSHGEKSPQY